MYFEIRNFILNLQGAILVSENIGSWEKWLFIWLYPFYLSLHDLGQVIPNPVWYLRPAEHTSNTLQQHVAATNREFLRKSLSPQQNFVTATSRTKSNQIELAQLVTATKFCCVDKDFHQNSPVNTKPFVAATCGATCCSNISPDLYTRSNLSSRSVVATCRSVYTDPTGSYITWVGSVKRGMSVLFTVELDPAVELGTWNRLHQPVSHNSSKLCGVRIK